MEVVCLDTSILIDYYRSKDKKSTFWYKLSHDYHFKIPTIVQYEILRGDKKKDAFWLEVFGRVPLLPFDGNCAIKAAEIYRKLKASSQLLGPDDILIAATSIVNDLPLATFNKSHFNRIEELNLVTE